MNEKLVSIEQMDHDKYGHLYNAHDACQQYGFTDYRGAVAFCCDEDDIIIQDGIHWITELGFMNIAVHSKLDSSAKRSLLNYVRKQVAATIPVPQPVLGNPRASLIEAPHVVAALGLVKEELAKTINQPDLLMRAYLHSVTQETSLSMEHFELALPRATDVHHIGVLTATLIDDAIYKRDSDLLNALGIRKREVKAPERTVANWVLKEMGFLEDKFRQSAKRKNEDGTPVQIKYCWPTDKAAGFYDLARLKSGAEKMGAKLEMVQTLWYDTIIDEIVAWSDANIR